MQVDLRIPPTKIFFKTSTVLFPPFLKYHIVFQDQSKDYIRKDDIIDIHRIF